MLSGGEGGVLSLGWGGGLEGGMRCHVWLFW